MPRSPLLHGLRLTVRHPAPLLWTYLISAVIAWLGTITLRMQVANVTSTSLAAQRMIGGFDLGTVIDVFRRIHEGPPGTAVQPALGVPVYLSIFFLLVPGTLLVYRTNRGLSLGALLQTGLAAFWSFVRITLLTAAVCGPLLGALFFLGGMWFDRVDETITGEPAFLLDLIPVVILLSVAALLRLYFDLVEVHTIRLGQTLRSNNRPDRRVRKAIAPAWRSLRRNFLASCVITFLFLFLLGTACAALLGLSALHRLGQPRVWPTLLLAQLGIFLMIFTRCWQRAAETVIVERDYPDLPPSPIFAPKSDPIPDPEPAAPSLGIPDPEVFHHQLTPAPPAGSTVDESL